MQPQISRLSWAMRAGAIAIWLFSVPALVLLIVAPDMLSREHDNLFNKLLVWGEGGNDYAVMIMTILAVWGWFLWLAAKDPVKNELFILFTIFTNLAHITAMLIMALRPGHHMHLLGDVPIGLGLSAFLFFFWLQYRNSTKKAVTK